MFNKQTLTIIYLKNNSVFLTCKYKEFYDIEDAKIFIPLFMSRVKDGFPSPAEEYIEAKLDLNSYLIQHPSSTYMVRIKGDSMIGAGIYSGNLAVVDRSLEPKNQDIVIAVVDQEITIKRLVKSKKGITLCVENPNFEPINFTSDQELIIWGVVVHTVRSMKR